MQVEGAGEWAGDKERGGDCGTDCLVHEVLREACQFPGASCCSAACNPWDCRAGQGSILPSFIQHVPGTWHCVGTEPSRRAPSPKFLRELRPETKAPGKRNL